MTLVEAYDPAVAGVAGGNGNNGGTGPPRDARDDADARLVTERWKAISDELAGKRRDWWQNVSFFLGEQWIYWDKARRMQRIAHDVSPLGPGKARIVVNRVGPNLVNLLARLMRNDLEFDVPPASSADDVVSAAMLAEDVCNGSYHDQNWHKARYDELFAAYMGGTSAIALEWDATAGVQLEQDPATGQVTGTGEVRLTALNITEFGLEPGMRDEVDARWWVQGLVLAPKTVKDQYKLSWTPSADAAATMSPTQHSLLQQLGRSRGSDMTLVLIMYERPNNEAPSGRYRVVVNERTIASSNWPFHDKERLNLQLFHETQLQGSWMGSTMMNDAVKVQYNYNFIRSNIAEHAKKTGNTRIIQPMGATEEDVWTNVVGDVVDYAPDIAGGKPEYMAPPQLPRWMLQEAQDLRMELDDIMHVHETSRGTTSIDRASGQTLALLSEKDDTPLGLLAFEQSKGWSRIASWVLKEYEQRVTETREVNVPAPMGSEQMGDVRLTRWNGKALKGQTRVYVPLESTMPYSQAAMHAFVTDMLQQKVITDPMVAVRMLRLPQRELIAIIDADVRRAQKENERLALGSVEMPQGFDDHGKHIAEHNRFRKSDSYQFAPQTIKQLIDDHIQMHENMVHEEAANQVLRAHADPLLAALPQAAEPAGSQVPPDYAEQRAGIGTPNPGDVQAAAALAAGGGGGPPGAPPGGAPAPSAPPPEPPGGSTGIAAGGAAR